MVAVGHFRGRQLLPALSLVIGLTIGCGQSRSESMPGWMQPGVRTGIGTLAKRLYATADGMGSLTDIQYGELRARGKVELGIAGNYGAGFFDEAGKPTATVDFAVREPGASTEILPQSRSHGLLLFRHGSFANDSLTDAGGKEIWRTPYRPAASTFGDLQQEGVPEFVFVGPGHCDRGPKPIGSGHLAQ